MNVSEIVKKEWNSENGFSIQSIINTLGILFVLREPGMCHFNFKLTIEGFIRSI